MSGKKRGEGGRRLRALWPWHGMAVAAQQPFREVESLLQFGEPLVDEVEFFLPAGNVVLEPFLLALRALQTVPEDDAAPGRHDDEAVHECPREQLDRHSASMIQRAAWVRFELTEPFPVRRFSRPLP